MRAGKGANFERELCKMLSRWWTEGKRDDVFWRTSQSGGRATQRAKGGLRTHGSYGDIAAVDPVGAPLVKMFTIELKRGNSHGNPVDLFDALPTKAVRGWERCLTQAVESARLAGSESWMLIGRRDRKEAMVYLATRIAFRLNLQKLQRIYRFKVRVNGLGDLDYFCISLQIFLQNVQPSQIISLRQVIKDENNKNRRKEK